MQNHFEKLVKGTGLFSVDFQIIIKKHYLNFKPMFSALTRK